MCMCVCRHSSLDTFLAAPHQLESDQLPCSIGWLAAGAFHRARCERNLASAYELAHCSTLAPRSAHKKMMVASPQKPSISMPKN